MTCTTPLPEHLDPPDTASECAICHRVTEDGRDLDLCDEAVDTLRNAALVCPDARIHTGKQFVCESCLDDLHPQQERHRAEAFDTISDALSLDEYEHPALRARKVIAASRLPAIKTGEVVVSREELAAFRELEHQSWSALDEVENHGECDMTGISDAYKALKVLRAQDTTSREEAPC